MRRGYLATPFGRIHFRAAGDQGEPLLLLHQTPFSSLVYTPAILPALAQHFQVVAIDTPGYGESDPPPPGEWQVPDYARAVLAALDALGWPQAHLVGRLTGCSIAVEVAALAPARVRGLVLSALPDYDEATRRERLAALSPIRYLPDGSQANAVWRFLRQANPTLPLETVHLMTGAMLRAGSGNEEADRAVFSYDPKPSLPAITAPTLLLLGEHDYFHDRLVLIRPLIRQHELRIIPGGRQLIFENPTGFAATVCDFLTHLPPVEGAPPKHHSV